MPIYEYKCSKCGNLFDVFQSIGSSNENLNCPSCGEPKPDRIFSIFGSGKWLFLESYPSHTMQGLIFRIHSTITSRSKSTTGSIVTILRECLILRKDSYLWEGRGALEMPSYRLSLFVSMVVPRMILSGRLILVKV